VYERVTTAPPSKKGRVAQHNPSAPTQKRVSKATPPWVGSPGDRQHQWHARISGTPEFVTTAPAIWLKLMPSEK